MAHPKILVYGDVMLDVYVAGTVKRDSPEAPGVPVLSDHEMVYFPGGAANVAANVAALGGEVIVLGMVGPDPSASMLEMALADMGVSMEFLIRETSRTTAKTRVVGDGRPIVRLDMETLAPLSGEDETETMAKLSVLVPQSQAVVISDYAKGAVTPKLAAGVIRVARSWGIPVVVDAKQPLAECYYGATVIKPNLKEAAEAQKRPIPTKVHDALSYAGVIWLRGKSQYVLMTMGALGMALACAGGEVLHLPAHTVKEVDVTGAGDAVAAALAMALARGEDIVEASLYANAAAAVVVTKRGTACPSPDEIRFFYDHESGRPRARRSSMAQDEASNRLH